MFTSKNECHWIALSTGKATHDPSTYASIPCSLKTSSDQKVFLSSGNLMTGHVDVRIFCCSWLQGQQTSQKSHLLSLKLRDTSGCSIVAFFFLSRGRVCWWKYWYLGNEFFYSCCNQYIIRRMQSIARMNAKCSWKTLTISANPTNRHFLSLFKA